MEEHLLLGMDHGKLTEITGLVNSGNGGWDPRPNVAGRGDCPDKYYWIYAKLKRRNATSC